MQRYSNGIFFVRNITWNDSLKTSSKRLNNFNKMHVSHVKQSHCRHFQARLSNRMNKQRWEKCQSLTKRPQDRKIPLLFLASITDVGFSLACSLYRNKDFLRWKESLPFSSLPVGKSPEIYFPWSLLIIIIQLRSSDRRNYENSSPSVFEYLSTMRR